MSATLQSPIQLLDELAELFASTPTHQQILDFRPSSEAQEHAGRLLERNRSDALTETERRELDQFEQAEVLMRLVKARIRANHPS